MFDIAELQVGKTWGSFFEKEFQKNYFTNIVEKLEQEIIHHSIAPKKENIFKAFELTHFENVKVVILGQDPYHQINKAHGLAFSVEDHTLPLSLQNIFKEIENNFSEIRMPKNFGNLSAWSQQGVLLLNSILTVRLNEAASHAQWGWQMFTDNIIQYLAQQKQNLVFILWGNYAKQKIQLINSPSHLILTAAHPSPFSARSGFFNCKHFLQTNNFLTQKNLTPIRWQLNPPTLF